MDDEIRAALAAVVAAHGLTLHVAQVKGRWVAELAHEARGRWMAQIGLLYDAARLAAMAAAAEAWATAPIE